MPRRAGTLAACERSLARLKTDRLDCYLLHWRGSYPLEDTIAAFERTAARRARSGPGASAISTSTTWRRHARSPGSGKIACNQVLYHLQERAIEHAVIPWCEKHGVAVVAYSPFGQATSPAASTPGGRVLAEIAAAHGATPRQVALAFLTRSPAVFVIPKASRLAHVEENAGAGDLRLPPDALARLDQAFRRGARPRSLPMI